MMFHRNAFPTRMGLGSHGCCPGLRAHRRSTSGWMSMCAAAILVCVDPPAKGRPKVRWGSADTTAAGVVGLYPAGAVVEEAPGRLVGAEIRRVSPILMVSPEPGLQLGRCVGTEFGTTEPVTLRWEPTCCSAAARQRRASGPRILARPACAGVVLNLHRAPCFCPINGSSLSPDPHALSRGTEANPHGHGFALITIPWLPAVARGRTSSAVTASRDLHHCDPLPGATAPRKVLHPIGVGNGNSWRTGVRARTLKALPARKSPTSRSIRPADNPSQIPSGSVSGERGYPSHGNAPSAAPINTAASHLNTSEGSPGFRRRCAIQMAVPTARVAAEQRIRGPGASPKMIARIIQYPNPSAKFAASPRQSSCIHHGIGSLEGCCGG